MNITRRPMICAFFAAFAVVAPVVAQTPTFATESPTISLETDKGCLLPNCHGSTLTGRFSDGEGASIAVDRETLRKSAHRGIACLECHTDIASIPHSRRLNPVDCESCHYENNPRGAPNSGQFREFAESIHGQRVAAGDANAPRCSTCHGGHDTKPADDPESRVNRENTPKTCGECHTDEYERYSASIHGSELARKNLDVPVCASCHGVHNIRAHTDPFSKVYPTHVAETCAECHAAVEVADRYGFSAKRVSTYEDSFHGFASKFGATVVANCASCHGVHDMLPQDDPRSTIHPTNIRRTCGKDDCHPRASARFASGDVHIGAAAPPAFVVRLVAWTYKFLIAAVIGGMVLHNLLDFRAQLRRRGARKAG